MKNETIEILFICFCDKNQLQSKNNFYMKLFHNFFHAFLEPFFFQMFYIIDPLNLKKLIYLISFCAINQNYKFDFLQHYANENKTLLFYNINIYFKLAKANHRIEIKYFSKIKKVLISIHNQIVCKFKYGCYYLYLNVAKIDTFIKIIFSKYNC